MPTIADVYFTTGQAASALKVNRLTVQRWVQSGKLSGQRIGNVTLIPITEVEKLRSERDRQPQPQPPRYSPTSRPRPSLPPGGKCYHCGSSLLYHDYEPRFNINVYTCGACGREQSPSAPLEYDSTEGKRRRRQPWHGGHTKGQRGETQRL